MSKIVNAKVVKINKNSLVVMYANDLYTLAMNQISDYKVELNNIFTENRSYKFELKNKQLFYKTIRPKQLKNNNKIIPTINGSKNLEKHLLKLLNTKNKKSIQNNN